MIDKMIYLKQNVIAEPLFNQWYAWTYLISPASAAMYIEKAHIKTMKSFISAPQIHISALKNPELKGGPFINYDESKIPDIKNLLENTLKKNSKLLQLAQAIKELRQLLKKSEGYSLEPLYCKIPEVLRGYVELVYDLDNRPSFRIIEGLLYHSSYYNKFSQSIALSLLEEDNRPFALSTPRIQDKHTLHLEIPFSSILWDQLFKMRCTPGLYEDIKNKLNIPIAKEPLFTSFFTEQPPISSNKPSMHQIRIRYLGHACVLIETEKISILCDPLLSYSSEKDLNRYTFSDLPNTIDYILITHNHQDHCMLESLLQLRYKTKIIIVPKNSSGELADPSLKLLLKKLGFNDVREIDVMETLEFNGGFIQGLPFLGEHGDLNILTKTAYNINIEGYSIVLAADSNNIESRLYKHIRDILNKDIDILFLGMECDGAPLSWIYNPLLTLPLSRKMDQSRRLDGSNFERALDVINCLKPKQVYIYAMGEEPWLSFIMETQYTKESRPIVESDKLVNACRALGLISERLCGQKEILLNSKNQGNRI